MKNIIQSIKKIVGYCLQLIGVLLFILAFIKFLGFENPNINIFNIFLSSDLQAYRVHTFQVLLIMIPGYGFWYFGKKVRSE